MRSRGQNRTETDETPPRRQPANSQKRTPPSRWSVESLHKTSRWEPLERVELVSSLTPNRTRQRHGVTKRQVPTVAHSHPWSIGFDFFIMQPYSDSIAITNPPSRRRLWTRSSSSSSVVTQSSPTKMFSSKPVREESWSSFHQKYGSQDTTWHDSFIIWYV